MSTIAKINTEQTVNDYISSLYDYIFNIGNFSTYSLYEGNTLVSKPTILNDFLPYFKQYASKMKLDKKYIQKPGLFALDYYGSSELEWLVLYISGISHPIDFTLEIIDVIPVSMLTDLNKLNTLSKETVRVSKSNPEVYTSSNIDISRQTGFIEERYIYQNDSRLLDKAIQSGNKNRLGNKAIGGSSMFGDASTYGDTDKSPILRGNRSKDKTVHYRLIESQISNE